MTFEQKIESCRAELSEKYYHLFLEFYTCYKQALEAAHIAIAPFEPIFEMFLKNTLIQIKDPYRFSPYHKQILEPQNFYRFGVDFIKPLVDLEHSKLEGRDHLDQITKQLKANENIVFFANHQIEADPQVISVLLEPNYPDLAQFLIFVAGERVLTDPLAIPFSMGRNLLCIYSKRYIDHPPHLKTEKQLHNKKTMDLMAELLSEGGHAIYVAPSGGRDRMGPSKKIEVAPFDPKSIEMFDLMSKQSSFKTHFYPMALYTYPILPPPETIQVELGEARRAQRSAVYLSIGPEIEMANLNDPSLDRKQNRQNRAQKIWSQVCMQYAEFPV